MDTSPGVRRRVPIVLVGLLTLGVIAGAVAGVAMRPGISDPKVSARTGTATCASTGTRSITCASLPFKATFNQLLLAHGELLVTGEVGSGVDPTPLCASAPVNPSTLRLGPVTRSACDNPTLSGHSASAVTARLPDSNNATLAVAHVDPATGRVVVGPVLMTYGSYSDTAPVTAYGGGWLWIYDVEATAGPEVLQVSAATGQLEHTLAMPQLFRPLMAANGTGLFIGTSISGGVCSGCGTGTLYHLAPGSDSATLVIPGSLPECWLVAEGDAVFVGLGQVKSGCGTPTTLRFDGIDAHPVFRTPDRYEPIALIGRQAGGILMTAPPQPYSVDAPGGVAELLIRIDTRTGRATVVDRLPPQFSTGNQDFVLPGAAQVTFDGSLYTLVPPAQDGVVVPIDLVRVRLPPATPRS